MSRTVLAALCLTLATCPPAFAASAPVAAPSAPGAQPPLGGPVVKGVCLLSQDAVVRDAKAGVAASQRLQQLRDQAQGEINAARAPIDADYKTLQADAPKGAPADIEKRRVAIQARYQVVQGITDQRNREIEATRAKVVDRLAAAMEPVVAQVYKAHGCGLLFNRNAVIGGNLSEDLTGDVIKGLDARVAAIPFDREVLPAAR